MKIGKLTMLALALCVSAGTVQAQKVQVKEGKIDALKGATAINVEYDYSGMTVGKGKTEAEYISQKKEEYNKKEPGRGDSWEKTWKDDRKTRYEKRFQEEFEDQTGMKIGNKPDAKYTLILKTTRTEPGYNVYMARKNAEIDCEAWIVETANHSNVVAKLTADGCPGRTFSGNDFETGERLQEAYAMAGKTIGKYIKKEFK